MDAVRVQHYIDRARDFFKGMQLVRDDVLYQNTAALLAIHSAISYSDALRTGLGDVNINADDHNQAVKSLLYLLQQRRWNDHTGFTHLQYLMSQKSAVAYSSRRLDESEVRHLTAKAERFATWVNNIGIKLRLKGWTHDDQ